jgi:hypothetical protein
MLLAPAFALGYVVGQKSAEESLKADRARVVKKDLELKEKEKSLLLWAQKLNKQFPLH